MATKPKMSHMAAMKKAAHHHEQAHKWIQEAIKHPGALHKELHVPEGKKIPAKTLAKASKKPGVEGKRARLAETLKGMKK